MIHLFVLAQVAKYQNRKAAIFVEHYFKTSSQMIELFQDIPEAIENSLVIAKRCSVMAETRAPILPAFATSAGRDEAAELRAQAESGLQARLERHLFTEVA